jgi:hypothetical protein
MSSNLTQILDNTFCVHENDSASIFLIANNQNYLALGIERRLIISFLRSVFSVGEHKYDRRHLISPRSTNKHKECLQNVMAN